MVFEMTNYSQRLHCLALNPPIFYHILLVIIAETCGLDDLFPLNLCPRPETLCWYIYIYIYLYVCIIYTSSVLGRIYTHTQGVSLSIGEAAPLTHYRTVLGECAVPMLNATFLWFVSCSVINSNTRLLVTFGICSKQHFDTRYAAFRNLSPPRMFLPLDLLSECRIQHGAIGPLYVTSSHSTWIFCRGVSCFATDCPCGVWCRGLTTYLLYVGPLFGNRFLNNSEAVGLT